MGGGQEMEVEVRVRAVELKEPMEEMNRHWYEESVNPVPMMVREEVREQTVDEKEEM